MKKLKQLPVYYEKYTSFETRDIHILDSIHAVMESLPDVNFEKGSNSIKVVYWYQGEACDIRVKRFDTGKGTIICEFSRRSGSVFAMIDFYYTVLKLLPSESIECDRLKTAARTRITQRPDHSVKIDEQTLDNLMSMASCGYTDLEQEGIRALVQIKTQLTLTDNFAKLLEKNLRHENIEVVTNSLEIIHHFTEKTIALPSNIYKALVEINYPYEHSYICARAKDYLKKIAAS